MPGFRQRKRLCLIARSLDARSLTAIGGLATALCLAAPCAAQVGPATLRIAGSPQMADLLHRYEADFSRLHPQVRFSEDLQNTLAAVPAVAVGKADIGLLGREIWPEERAAFVTATGQQPGVIDVATGSFDVPKATFALMIFVPENNPYRSLSKAQLASIFSADRTAHTWGDLGLPGDFARHPIHLYGFLKTNDKSQIFRKLVFPAGADWSPSLHEFGNAPDGTDAGELIVRAVAADPDGIGISNIYYGSPAVRALAISTKSQPIAPTRENVAARVYPLTRAVYLVVGPHPSAATWEFLLFALSPAGAQAVREEGNYLPLPPDVAQAQLQRMRRGRGGGDSQSARRR